MHNTKRCFHENPSVNEYGPIYTCPDGLNQDISDLFMSHYGQNLNKYSIENVEEHIKRFCEHYGIELLPSTVDFRRMENEVSDMEENDSCFANLEQFVQFWNRYVITP